MINWEIDVKPKDFCDILGYIELSDTELTLNTYKSELLFVTPYDIHSQVMDEKNFDIKWTSSDPSLVWVEDGLISTGCATGTATITVSICDQTTTCTVEVTPDCENEPLQNGCKSRWIGTVEFTITLKQYSNPGCSCNEGFERIYQETFQGEIVLEIDPPNYCGGDYGWQIGTAYYNGTSTGHATYCNPTAVNPCWTDSWSFPALGEYRIHVDYYVDENGNMIALFNNFTIYPGAPFLTLPFADMAHGQLSGDAGTMTITCWNGIEEYDNNNTYTPNTQVITLTRIGY